MTRLSSRVQVTALRPERAFAIRGSERIQRLFELTDLDARLPLCDDET